MCFQPKYNNTGISVSFQTLSPKAFLVLCRTSTQHLKTHNDLEMISKLLDGIETNARVRARKLSSECIWLNKKFPFLLNLFFFFFFFPHVTRNRLKSLNCKLISYVWMLLCRLLKEKWSLGLAFVFLIWRKSLLAALQCSLTTAAGWLMLFSSLWLFYNIWVNNLKDSLFFFFLPFFLF